MTSPFAPLSSAGSWLKPAERNGHLLVIANAQFVGRKYDEMRKAEVDVVKFDYADLNAEGTWETGAQSNHPGITNKLAGILNSGGMVLGRIGQITATNGHQAWVLAEADPATDVPAASAWVGANPAPAMASPFAGLAPAPAPAPVVAPVAAPVVAAPVAAPAAAPAPQATVAGGDVAALLAQLQAAQAAAG